VRAAVIGQLMCQGVIDIGRIEQQYAIDLAAYFGAALAQLKSHVADGLVCIADGRISVTPAGRLLLRSIAMCFDAYLDATRTPEGPRPAFSRVV